MKPFIDIKHWKAQFTIECSFSRRVGMLYALFSSGEFETEVDAKKNIEPIVEAMTWAARETGFDKKFTQKVIEILVTRNNSGNIDIGEHEPAMILLRTLRDFSKVYTLCELPEKLRKSTHELIKYLVEDYIDCDSSKVRIELAAILCDLERYDVLIVWGLLGEPEVILELESRRPDIPSKLSDLYWNGQTSELAKALAINRAAAGALD